LEWLGLLELIFMGRTFGSIEFYRYVALKQDILENIFSLFANELFPSMQRAKGLKKKAAPKRRYQVLWEKTGYAKLSD
jgi:hypothetical protein